MPAGFSSSDQTELIQSERDVQARIAGSGSSSTSPRSPRCRTSSGRPRWCATTWSARCSRRPTCRSRRSPCCGCCGSGASRRPVAWPTSRASRAARSPASIGTLEARGLVQRRPHPDDRRSVLMSTTADGDALMRRSTRSSTARRRRCRPSSTRPTSSRSPTRCARCCAPSSRSTADLAHLCRSALAALDRDP